MPIPLYLIIANVLDADGQPETLTLATSTCSPASGTGLAALGLPEGTLFDGVVVNPGKAPKFDSLDEGGATAKPLESVSYDALVLNAPELLGYVWTDAVVTCYEVLLNQTYPQNPDISGRTLAYSARAGDPRMATGSDGRRVTIPLQSPGLFERPYPVKLYRGFGNALRFTGGSVDIAPATRYVPGGGNFSVVFRMRGLPGSGGPSGTILDTSPPAIKIEAFGNLVRATITGTGGAFITDAAAAGGTDVNAWSTLVARKSSTGVDIATAIDGYGQFWPNQVVAVGNAGTVGAGQTLVQIGNNIAGTDPYSGDLDELYLTSEYLDLASRTLWETPAVDPRFYGVRRMDAGVGGLLADDSIAQGGGVYLECLPGYADAGDVLNSEMTGGFSAGAWVWFSSSVTQREVMRKVSGAPPNGFRLLYWPVSPTEDRFSLLVGDGTIAPTVNYVIPPSESFTYPRLVMGTFDAGTKTLRLYVDGVLRAESAQPSLGAPTYSGKSLLLGGASAGANGATGIAGAFVYDRVVTEAEAASLALGPASSRLPGGLVGYWPMTDGSGPTATDTIGGNDATLTGSATWQTNVGTISTIGAGVDWIGSGAGPASIRGKVRQEVWGDRRAVAVEAVDSQRAVFEASALSSTSVLPVVGGARLSPGDEVTLGPSDDLYTVTLTPGQWCADVTGPTVFRLGAAPADKAAADVTGGGIPEADAGSLLAALLESAEAGLSAALDADAIVAATRERPDSVGFVIAGPVVTAKPVQGLLDAMRGYLSTDPSTWLLRLLLLDAEDDPVRTLTADDVDLQSLAVRGLGAPPERTVRASYDPRGVTWDLGETSGLLDQLTRGDVARDSLDTGTVTTADAVGLAIGTDRAWETIYATEQGARLAAERRIATQGRQRATLSCRVLGRRDVLQLGDDWTVDLSVGGVNLTGVKVGSVWRLMRITRPLNLDAVDCVFLGYQSSLGD